jgi:hypothetical protein
VIILIVVAALAALSGIGWGISTLLSKQKATVDNEQQQGYMDTIPQERAIDSVTQPQAVPTVSQPETGDSVRYKMVFETTRFKERAIKRTTQLNTLRSYTSYDSLRINDSLKFYRLFLPVKIKPADTTRYKDSLRIFFGHPIRVLRQ